MCGRFTLTDPDQNLAVQFGLPHVPQMRPRYNIAPTQPVAVVRTAPEASARQLALLRWGLIPFWAKDPKIGTRMINARSETAADKPAFRAAFRRRRCLVLADGFYEWKRQDGGKQPFYITMSDGKAFGFAGLWERWQSNASTVIDSCTLLTTEPNDLVGAIHDRMPVIVHPSDYTLWLDTDAQDIEMLQSILEPFPAEAMKAYAVSRWVNSPKNDDARCIEPLPLTGTLRMPGL